MPMHDPFQAEVARIAIHAAAAHSFALGGGQALVAHGIVHRQTEDIDLFADTEGSVQRAAAQVQASLIRAGLEVEIIPETNDLGEIFYGFADDFVEFEVRRVDDTVRLTLARFDRTRDPVAMEIGIVLHIDDVVGSKVAAMATRAEPRDFVDVAAAIPRFGRDQLLVLGRQADPALTDDEIAEAMRTLDRLPNVIFARWIAASSVPSLRAAFSDWPR